MSTQRIARQPRIVIRGSVLHRAGQAVLFGGVALYFIRAGLSGNRTSLALLTDAIILAIAVTGLNLITGFTGQISIGHSAFFGIGAYTTAILVDGGWTHGWTFPVAAIVTFVIGCIVGLPALRLRGIYLALVTLGLAVAFPAMLNYKHLVSLTGGAVGIKNLTYLPPEWTGLKGRGDLHLWMFWLALGVFVIVSIVSSNLLRSRIGRAMIAVRDNETAAAVMGVDRAVIKTVVFGLSAVMAGVAGGLFAVKLTLVDPTIPLFTILGAITILVAMVIGGPASTWGPLVGALFYTYVNDWARTQGENHDINGLAGVIFGAILIVLARFAPFGIVGLLRKARSQFVRIIPKPLVALAGNQSPASVTSEADREPEPHHLEGEPRT